MPFRVFDKDVAEPNFLNVIDDLAKRVRKLENLLPNMLEGNKLVPPADVEVIGLFRGLGPRQLADGKFGVGNPILLVIDSGEVTMTKSFHELESESSTSDTLDTINGGAAGDILFLIPTSGHTITFSNGVGNVYNASVESQMSGYEFALCIFDGTNWLVCVT